MEYCINERSWQLFFIIIIIMIIVIIIKDFIPIDLAKIHNTTKLEIIRGVKRRDSVLQIKTFRFNLSGLFNKPKL